MPVYCPTCRRQRDRELRNASRERARNFRPLIAHPAPVLERVALRLVDEADQLAGAPDADVVRDLATVADIEARRQRADGATDRARPPSKAATGVDPSDLARRLERLATTAHGMPTHRRVQAALLVERLEHLLAGDDPRPEAS
jgi:hypothetical protein